MANKKSILQSLKQQARRAAILSQIQQWNNKLSAVDSQLSGLTEAQKNLNTYLEEWEAQKRIYNGSKILSEVVVVNEFEGVCADKIKDDFSSCIREMDQTYSRVSGLNGNVSTQIVRLNQYKTDINAQLTSLNNQLRSI